MIGHDGYLKSLLEIIAAGRVIRGFNLQLDYNPITAITSDLFYFSSFN
jgi:hypothetical protein